MFNYCNRSSASALTFPCGSDNLTVDFSVSCPNLFCLLRMASSPTSSKMAVEKTKNPNNNQDSRFIAIYHSLRPSGRDNFKSCSCIILFTLVMLVTNNHFSEMFNNG